jgi:c-di-GMP-related signal transduction protein
MQEVNFIVREPLLNAEEGVIGYELSWQRKDKGEGGHNLADATSLVRFVSDQVSEIEPGALLRDQVVFLPAPAALLNAGAFTRLPHKGTVLTVYAPELADRDTLAAVKVLRAKGFGISLRQADLATVDRNLLQFITHVEVSIDASDFDAQEQYFRSLNLPPTVRLVGRNVTDWQQYDACAALGMNSFVGKLHLTPRQENRTRDLSPAQTMILQLMDMVRNEADVRQLEGVLKRDPALSYKLLRYINSVGFGLGCEIQSLKHAVTLLGYSPLFRWLALLLATASTSGYSPVLMQTAVVRGRFSELLGQSFLPRNEAENLFVAGMFSLLDKLLGIPMEDVLEKIQLSDAVSEALLSRQGIYGPFLALAEACELNAAQLESMATALCISPRQVNQAHLSALAWVRNLKL